MCPYYFDLEEKFLERAGIKPAATTDEVFGGNDDGQNIFDTNDGSYSYGDDLSDSSYVNEEDESSKSDNTPRRGLIVSNSKNKTTNSAKAAKGKESAKMKKTYKGSGDIDGFNALMMTIAKRKNVEMQATKNSNDKVDSIVHLMESWKSAHEAMGCPIKAAFACPAFEQFLDRKEKKKLIKYRREMDAPLSSDSSDE
jgi:hypothetical protein